MVTPIVPAKPGSTMEVSIIIPTLNESENIASLVDRILQATRTAAISIEIVVVDDGSTDGTREVVTDLSQTHPVRLIRRDTRKGLAGAVVAGAHAARYDTIVVMDADSSHSPSDIPRLLSFMSAESKTLVIGSRYTPGGETPDWPLKRKIASKVASFPAQILTGVDDPLSGFFAVPRETLCAINPDIQGYKICVEILLEHGDTLDVKEVPISFRDRASGRSKMDGSVAASYLLQLIGPCGSVSAGFRRLFPLLLITALVTDALAYAGCSLAGTTPVTRHAAAFGLSLLAVAFVVSRILPRKSCFATRVASASTLAGLFLVWVARLGIFSLLGSSASDQSAGYLPGSAATLFSAAALSFLFLANREERTGSRQVRLRLALVVVIVTSFIFRMLFSGSFELLKEEAYYWVYAQNLDIGYLDHPPMVAMLIHLTTFFMGNSEYAVRAGALCCAMLAAGFMYQYARDIAGRDSALYAVAIMSVVPGFFLFGFIITPDAPLIACWAGALFFLRRALVDHVHGNWVGAGIFIGLGMSSKYTIALLAPAILAYIIVDKPSRRLLVRPYPYGAALLALLVFFPVIFWNMQHEWASFLFQTQNRLEASSEFSTHELILFIIILLGPAGFAAALFFLFGRKKFVQIPEISNRNYTFALTMTVVPLLIFFFISLTKEVKFNWTCPLWLAALPFMAFTITDAFWKIRHLPGTRFTWPWTTTVAVFFFAYGIIFQLFSIGIPGIPYTGGGPLWSWGLYARQVDALVKSVEEQTGIRPLVVGMDQYKTASGIGYYRTRNQNQEDGHHGYDPLKETVGRNFAGNRSAVMYEYWFSPPGDADRPLVLVSPSRSNLDERWLTGPPETIGEIQRLDAVRNGEKVSPLYYRLANIAIPVQRAMESAGVSR